MTKTTSPDDGGQAPLAQASTTCAKGWWLAGIIPIVVAIVALFHQQTLGPQYLGCNADPGYVYLFNSLNLATGTLPYHVDHPGTTIQWIGALILHVLHGVDGKTTLIPSVLENPEHYLAGMIIAWLVIYAGSLWWLGWVARRATGSCWTAAALQATPFLFPECFLHLSRLTTETPQMVLANLVGILALEDLRSPAQSRWRRMAPYAWGILLGTAVATKVLFLPLAGLLYAYFTQRRDRFNYILCLGGSCLLWVAVALPQWGYMIRWFFRLATRGGVYGSGGQEIVNLERQTSWVLSCLYAYPVYSLGLGLLLAGWFWQLKNRKSQGGWENNVGLRLGTILLLAQFSGLLLVSKQPNPRYLILGWVLLMPSIWLICQSQNPGRANRICISLAIIPWLLFPWGVADQWRDARKLCEQQREAFRAQVFLKKFGPIIGTIGGSSPGGACAMGNGYAGGIYDGELQRIYGDRLGYDFSGFALHRNGESHPMKTTATLTNPLHPSTWGILQVTYPSYLTNYPPPWPTGTTLLPLCVAGSDTFYWLGNEAEIATFHKLKTNLAVQLRKSERW